MLQGVYEIGVSSQHIIKFRKLLTNFIWIFSAHNFFCPLWQTIFTSFRLNKAMKFEIDSRVNPDFMISDYVKENTCRRAKKMIKVVNWDYS